MRSPRHTDCRPGLPRRGVTFVELACSIVIVGVMMVGALATVRSVAYSRHLDADRQLARTLAEMFMAEIMSKEYADPNVVGYSLGPESNEQATGNRSLFDDVDDFNGWSSTPPEWPDGIDILDRQNWTESAEVVCTSPADFSMTLPSGWDFGVKRVTVTISYNGTELARLVAVRGRTKDYPYPW